MEDDITTVWARQDDTLRDAFEHVPPLAEVKAVVVKFPGLSVAYYDATANAATPWLWLDTPSGAVKLTDCREITLLEGVLAHIAASTEDTAVRPVPGARSALVCPRCSREVLRPSQPLGKQRCPDCYRNQRVMVTMLWRGAA